MVEGWINESSIFINIEAHKNVQRLLKDYWWVI